MIISTNLSSLITQSSLKYSTLKLNEAIERLTTGYKINHAKDNAAGYGIVQNMTTKLGSLSVAEDNASMALDLLSTVESTLSIVTSHVQRIRDLSEIAANETYSEESRAALQAEINSRLAEVDRIFESAEYNDLDLFSLAKDYGLSIMSAEVERIADETTTFQQLGITSTRFSVYDSSNTLLEEYTLDSDSTLGDFLDALKSQGFTTSINNGIISISSSSGKYITGSLADDLGITTNSTTVIDSSTMSSTLALTGTSTSTADVDTTFGELGISDSRCVVKNSGNSSIKTITVKSTDTLDSFITQLASRSITASLTDGVMSFVSDSGYTITGNLANSLGVVQNCVTTTISSTQTGSFYETRYSIRCDSTTETGTSTVSTGQFKAKPSVTDTENLISVSEATETVLQGTYKICTTEDLVKLSTMQNAGMVTSGRTYDSTFVLANDIDMSGIDWKPIGYDSTVAFLVFDGNGYTINNLTSSQGGLFMNTSNVTVRNLGLSNVDINTTSDTGGIAANFDGGEIFNCFVSGEITSTGEGGGLVNCARFTTISKCYADVDITAEFVVGGLCGTLSDSTLSSCFTTGSITGTGQALGAVGVGGVCGKVDGDSILSNLRSDCSINVGKVQNGGGIIGRFDIGDGNSSCGLRNLYFNGSISADGVYEQTIGSISASGYIASMSNIKNLNSSLSIPAIGVVYMQNLSSSVTLGSRDITSGNVLLQKDDGTTQTIYIDATKTFGDLTTQLTSYGFDVRSIKSGYEFKFSSSSGMHLVALDGGSNLVDKLYLSQSRDKSYTNTMSTTLGFTGTATITNSSTLSSLPSYNHGSGSLGIHLANGTTTTIQLNETDTLSDLFSKLTPYGITGSITDGKVTFSSSSDAYLESISGGSSLLSSLNLGALTQIQKVEHKNSPSNQLSYTTSDTPGPTTPPQPGPPPNPDNKPGNSPDFIFGGIGGDPDSSISIDLNFDFNLSVDVSTSEGARKALEDLDTILSELNTKQTEIGSASNRFLSVLEEISIQYENLVSSLSTLRDADIAEVSSDYIKWQILQQASATLLSTANQAPAVALGLL